MHTLISAAILALVLAIFAAITVYFVRKGKAIAADVEIDASAAVTTVTTNTEAVIADAKKDAASL